MAYGIVYVWTCLKTGMKYVGQTVGSIDRRWKGHVTAALRKQLPWKLHDAIREHGPESFSGQVVKECQTQKELNVVEKQFIAELNTMWPNGYNMRNGAQYTDESTRQLISKRTREAMAAIPEDERQLQKDRQRQAMLGHTLSVEGRANMSVAQKARKERGGSQAFFVAGGKSRKGYKHTEISKALMRENAKPRRGDDNPMKNPESRAKVSASLKGHPVSEETKLKIRQALARRREQRVAEKGR